MDVVYEDDLSGYGFSIRKVGLVDELLVLF